MRFAASIRGMRKHALLAQEELDIANRLITWMSEIQVTELTDPAVASKLYNASAMLLRVRDSIAFRIRFLQDSAEDVRAMCLQDQETLDDITQLTKALLIRE